MGVVNYGSQILTYSYGEEARAKNWNKLNYKIIPPGIYSGGMLNLTGVNQVALAPLVCYIDDDLTGVGVNVQTTTNVNLVVSPSAPYVVLRMVWVDTLNIFMDVLPLAYSQILPTDLIVGKAVYINGIIQSFFDYTLRSNALVTTLKNRNTEFLVTANDGGPNAQVQVAAGSFITNKKFITFNGGPSSALSNTTQGRVDLIYVDDTGTIQKVEGVDAISPVVPAYHGRMVVAEIHRGPTRTDIQSQDIVPINFRRYAIGAMSIDTYYVNWGITGLQVNASQIPIVSTDYGTQTVENALSVITNRANRTNLVANATVNSGKLVVESQAGAKQFSTTPDLGSLFYLPNTTTQLPLSGGSAILVAPNSVLLIFQDSNDTGKLKAVIGTIFSDNTITYGVPTTIDANQTTTINNCWVYQLSSSTAIICYEPLDSFKKVRVVVCSFSSTVITAVGSILTPTGVPVTSHSLLGFGLFDSTHAFVAYDWFVSAGTNTYKYNSACNLITITGINLSSGSQKTLVNESTRTSFTTVFADSRNLAVMATPTKAYLYAAGNLSNAVAGWKNIYATINLISGGTDLSISTSILVTPNDGNDIRQPIYGMVAPINKNNSLIWTTAPNNTSVVSSFPGTGSFSHTGTGGANGSVSNLVDGNFNTYFEFTESRGFFSGAIDMGVEFFSTLTTPRDLTQIVIKIDMNASGPNSNVSWTTYVRFSDGSQTQLNTGSSTGQQVFTFNGTWTDVIGLHVSSNGHVDGTSFANSSCHLTVYELQCNGPQSGTLLETTKLASIGTGVVLYDADLTAFNAIAGLNPLGATPVIVQADENTFVAIRTDTSGNIVSFVYKLTGNTFTLIDRRTLITNVSITNSRPALCKLDKTRYLLIYGDTTDGNKVKSRVVEFLCIPSTILGIANQSVIAGQTFGVTFGKFQGGFVGLTPESIVYPDATGGIVQVATVPIAIGKAITSTQILTNIMSSVIGA